MVFYSTSFLKGSDEMATKTKSNGAVNRVAELTIQPMNIGRLLFKLNGISPLVTHPFDEKSRLEILEKQTGKTKKAARDKRSPEDEFLRSFYWVDGAPPKPDRIDDGVPVYEQKTIQKALDKGKFGIPITAFKNAVISACRNTDIKMTQVKQMVFITGEHPDYAIIHSPNVPALDARTVRVNNKTPMERFRPKWDEWSTTIEVEFDANQLSRNQVVNLVNIAGYYVGVCEGRPEKSSLGWGRFEVQTA